MPAVRLVVCVGHNAWVAEELHLAEVVRCGHELTLTEVGSAAAIDICSVGTFWPKPPYGPTIDACLRGPFLIAHTARALLLPWPELVATTVAILFPELPVQELVGTT